MKKRILALLLILLCLPVTAPAEVAYVRQTRKFIDFPDLDEWRGHFTRVEQWTIVTADTLEEHLDMVLARGDSEEAVRARFAEESLIFEAYSEQLPQGACVRMEMYENDVTREVWHMRHVSTADRKELYALLEDGFLLPQYDVYTIQSAGSGTSAHLTAWFTNYPPAGHEAGKMEIHFRNGRMYVLSYNIYGRLSGRKSVMSSEDRAGYLLTPLDSQETTFRSKAQPRMPRLMLDSSIPALANVGEDVILTGEIEKGSKLTITVDGKEAEVTVDKKNRFTAVLPMLRDGDRAVTVTQTHAKYTTREQTFTINASSLRTPLTITAQPEVFATSGEQTIAGVTDPGATVTVQLDDGDNVAVPVDDAGAFTHTFRVDDAALHTLRLAAIAPGKDMTFAELPFVTQYATTKDGIRAFTESLTEKSVSELAADPAANAGERVKISVRIHDVTFNEAGVGLMCIWNATDQYQGDDIYLYVTLPGYLQDQLHTQMILTVYGTVVGPHEVLDKHGEPHDGMEIFVEYGTYLN